jgi:DNA polymerase elongation subunit (family B)
MMELKPLIYKDKIHPVMTDPQLANTPVGDAFAFDVESYWNYFLLSFKHVNSGSIVVFETEDRNLDIDKLNWILFRFLLIGFNSNSYDIPMIRAALRNCSAQELKQISNDIIFSGERFNNKVPYNHIDLIEVAPLQGSLKAYAARLHCERMQELPIDHNAHLTPEEKPIVRNYNWNDLDNTVLLYNELLPHIKLREQLSGEYRQDLRSKSDAQIAEAVIVSELKKLTGKWPKKPEFADDFAFSYQVPTFIRFETPALQDALRVIAETPFTLDRGGSPVMPEALGRLRLNLGGSTYQMGMGGLHSCEKSAAHRADAETVLLDRDVASYYPAIILNQRLYPEHLGKDFLTVYKQIVDRRLEAKRSGNKTMSDALKITINGSFGKFGNAYSTLYSPQLLIQVTLTGQLALLMLIERIENVGIPVVSGNTDGIVIKCPVAKREQLNQIIKEWEFDTNFDTEESEYAALYSRDVNNYIAVKTDGTCKTKGVFSERGSALNSTLSKNPETLLVSDSVQAFLAKGKPIEETVRNCRDVRRFASVRNVKGGAQKDGFYLGKVVRWYYAKNVYGSINYVLTGNRVPKTENAKPLMQLGEFPDDIDYDWYIREAYEMLYDLGYYQRAKQIKFF